ncbi:hypothetical protein [Catelliglobosispora koreensis]|uniref:hypothetical protein n=1 Tax=Catelliglobosispora koreensis TaxID=129052 RepID=UPI000375C851|nr:hypothetical protein [Catelliglobosispora koreensis]
MSALRWRTAVAVASALLLAVTFAAFSTTATAAVPVLPGWTHVWSDDFTGPAGSGVNTGVRGPQGIPRVPGTVE